MDIHCRHIIAASFLAYSCATASMAQDAGPQDAAALIAALRDDDVAWNALGAMRALRELPDSPMSELYGALDSDDWQQRQLAASLLWEFLHPHPSTRDDETLPDWRRTPQGAPNTRLYQVTIEGFREDSLPYDPDSRRYTTVFNAADGIRYLSQHAADARELLENGLESDDPQQQLLCALALGYGGVAEAATKAAPVLLPHLRDNDIKGDARWTTPALYRFGPAIIPSLRAARDTADEQQAQLIDLIIYDLASPPATRSDLESRGRFNTITQTCFDPAVAMPLDHSMWWLRQLSTAPDK